MKVAIALASQSTLGILHDVLEKILGLAVAANAIEPLLQADNDRTSCCAKSWVLGNHSLSFETKINAIPNSSADRLERTSNPSVSAVFDSASDEFLGAQS